VCADAGVTRLRDSWGMGAIAVGILMCAEAGGAAVEVHTV